MSEKPNDPGAPEPGDKTMEQQVREVVLAEMQRQSATDGQTKDNGWDEHRKLVLAELKRHGEECEKIIDRLNEFQVAIAVLKVKAGIWGAVAGAIPCVIALIFMWLKS